MMTLVDKLSHLGPVIETHSAWVFLGERFVVKTKKPVDLGFLDFSTRARRKAMCEAELRLNQRLAPSVYLSVVSILEKDGVTFVDDPEVDDERPKDTDGAALVDYGVKMRRLREADRGDILLGEGALDGARADLVASTIADFHGRCASSPDMAHFGRVEAIRASVIENFEQARPLLSVLATEVDTIESYQRSFLESHSDLFARRAEEGFVRDGHGDLRLEHLYFEGGNLVIIDCIEFNDRFRYADVVSDLAFLTMDLRHGRSDELAERLIARYAQHTRDYELYRLVDFYESYRAFVRAKVTAILRAQRTSDGTTPSLDGEIVRFCEQAARPVTASGSRPRVICVGGVIASGKTTVCERLRASTCPIVIDSDTTRKHLHGVRPEDPCHEPAFHGMYSPDQSARVYERMRNDARFVLASGRSVIIEASFSKRRARELFHALADEQDADICFIECRVPMEIARERLLRRETTGGVSDGRTEIYQSFLEGYEPIESVEFEKYLLLETHHSEAEQRKSLGAFL